MRELTTIEMNEVAGGCYSSCRPQPVCNPQPCGSSAASITAYAGYLAGTYNVYADLFNHASCSTIQSAIQNVYADVQAGYKLGLSMTVSDAKALLSQVQTSIRNAVTTNSCGWVTAMTLVDFPPNDNGGFGS